MGVFAQCQRVFAHNSPRRCPRVRRPSQRRGSASEPSKDAATHRRRGALATASNTLHAPGHQCFDTWEMMPWATDHYQKETQPADGGTPRPPAGRRRCVSRPDARSEARAVGPEAESVERGANGRGRRTRTGRRGGPHSRHCAVFGARAPSLLARSRACPDLRASRKHGKGAANSSASDAHRRRVVHVGAWKKKVPSGRLSCPRGHRQDVTSDPIDGRGHQLPGSLFRGLPDRGRSTVDAYHTIMKITRSSVKFEASSRCRHPTKTRPSKSRTSSPSSVGKPEVWQTRALRFPERAQIELGRPG